MESKAFIEQYLIAETKNLLKNKSYYPLLIYATIGIETLGAIIDNKPIRARDQSKFRFASALYHLFPNQYGFVNKNNFLYEALRNHGAHNLIPSSKLNIIHQQQKGIRHLDQSKEQVSFIIETFAMDFLEACRLTVGKIDSSTVKNKKIAI
jgi:hypothetical protein